MKKIIAVTAMAAVVAASAMAVEMSAQAKLSGKVLNYDGSQFSMFTMDEQAPIYDGGTGVSFSLNGEKAGGSFRIHGPNYHGANFRLDGIGIWAKPIDMLKIQVGDWGYGVNKEDITWSRINFDWVGGGAFNFQLAPVAGLTLDVGFSSDFIMNGDLNGALTFQVAYGADFGSVKALGKIAKDVYNFAAEYAGNVGPVYLVVNGGVGIASSNVSIVDGSVYAKYAADALAVKGYVYYGNKPSVSDTALANTLKVAAKVEYNLGAVGLFAQVSADDLIEDSFAGVKVNPGVTFAIGESNWKVGAEMKIGSTFSIGVPVEVSISL